MATMGMDDGQSIGREGSGRRAKASLQRKGQRSIPMLLLLLLPLQEALVAYGETVTFQNDRRPTTGSYLEYRDTLPDLTSFTVCFRMFIEQFRPIMPILSYAVNDNPDELYISYDHDFNILSVECCSDYFKFYQKVKAEFTTWYSSCIAVNLTGANISLTWNSDLYEGYSEIALEYLPIQDLSGGGKILFGQEQQAFGGGFSKAHSFQGILTDFRFYDAFLTGEQMLNFSTCKDSISLSPIVDFSDIENQFDTNEVEISDDLDSSIICSVSNYFQVVFPQLVTFSGGVWLCDISGGRLIVPRDEESNEEIVTELIDISQECQAEDYADAIWIGFVINQETKAFSSYSDNTEGSYNNFMALDPTGEKCATVITSPPDEHIDSGKWMFTSCEEKRCTSCNYTSDSKQEFVLRGLCKGSHFDWHYTLLWKDKKPYFQGEYFSELWLEEDEDPSQDFGFYVLKSSRHEHAKAKLERNSMSDTPFGLNFWWIENDDCGSGEVPLILTKCKENQFTCGIGSCIDLDYRCDNELDCPDNSDEKNCSYISFSSTYRPDTIPPRKPSTPFIMNIFVTILAIREFDISGFQFKSELDITFKWYDERLEFVNLQGQSWKNIITENIWKPPIEYLGNSYTTCDVKRRKQSVVVERKSEPLPDHKKNVFEDKKYSGKTNPLKLKEKLTVTTACEFNLFYFPLDTQTCYLYIQVMDYPRSVLTLETMDSGIDFLGEREMMMYYLETFRIFNDSSHEPSRVCVQLVFENMWTYFISSTYVPTSLLLVIGYITFFFPLDDFNDRIMVALTGLLVEAAFFTQTSENIPTTAYMKMVDVWFVFCIVVLFCIMIALVIINWKVHNGKEDEASTGLCFRTLASSPPPQMDDDQRFLKKLAFVSPAEGADDLYPRRAIDIPPPAKYASPPGGAKRSYYCCSVAQLNLICEIVFPIVMFIFVVVYIVIISRGTGDGDSSALEGCPQPENSHALKSDGDSIIVMEAPPQVVID